MNCSAVTRHDVGTGIISLTLFLNSNHLKDYIFLVRISDNFRVLSDINLDITNSGEIIYKRTDRSHIIIVLRIRGVGNWDDYGIYTSVIRP